MPRPTPYSEYTSVVGLLPSPTPTPTTMSLPVSEAKLSPQDLAIRERFRKMRQENAVTPTQRWAASMAIAPARDAIEAAKEYWGWQLPRRPIDWVILAATEGMPQAQSLARFVEKIFGKASKFLVGAPKEITEASEMKLSIDDLENIGKMRTVPRDLLRQVAQKEEEKFLGMSAREVGEAAKKEALPKPGGETMVGPKGEIYPRPGEGGGLAPKPASEVAVRPKGEVPATPGREVTTTGRGGPAAARPAGGPVGPHVVEPVEVTRGTPRSPENVTDLGEEAEMVVPEDIQPTRHIPRPARSSLGTTGKWLLKGRLSTPIRGAVAGGMYDVLTGQDPREGVGQGLIAGSIGPVVGGAVELGGSFVGQGALERSGMREYGRALQKSLPEAKPVRDAGDIHRLHVTGELEGHYGERTRRVQEAVTKELKGRRLMIPVPGGQAAPMTLDAAFEYVNSEEQLARYESGLPGPMNTREHRMNAAKALVAIQEQLNDPQIGYPGLGDYVMQTRKDYGGAIELGKAARTPGLFDGRLFDWPKFQSLLATRYYRTLQSMFGPESADRIVRGSRRGAGIEHGTDVKGGDNTDVYMLGGIIPIPHIGRYHAVGDPAWWADVPRAAAVSKYLNVFPSSDQSQTGMADPTAVIPNLPVPPPEITPTPAPTPTHRRLKLTPVP